MLRSNALWFACALALPLAACDLGMPDDDDGAAETDGGGASADDDAPASDGDDESSDGGDDESSDGGALDSTSGGGAPIPAGLLGAWTIPGSVAGAAIAFADDSSYARANVGDTTIGSCTTHIEKVSAGTFVVTDDVIALHPLDALKTVDECGTVTEDTTLPADEELVWELGQDEYGDTLILTDADGYAAVYHRG